MEKDIPEKFLVCVRCMTFNHAKYIEDALNGFTMQETTFPFVCTIIDDASTDGEKEVIREYLRKNFELGNNSIVKNEETDDYVMTFAKHKTNHNCYFAVYFLKYNHFSNLSTKLRKLEYISKWHDCAKYVALCEGDDYWTHSQKLQKQIDFLEEHEDYSCCCHRFKIYYENTDTWTDDFVGKAFDEHPNVEGLEVTNSENFRTRFTSTLTLCFRKSVYDSIVWPPYKYGRRDFNSHYQLLKLGKGWCLADYMAVYRKNNGGAWSKLSPIEGAYVRLDCYEDLYKFNPADDDIKDAYSYWLDKFYNEFVIPPYRMHKLSKNGIKNLFAYIKHCQKAKSPFAKILKNITKCFVALLGIKRV